MRKLYIIILLAALSANADSQSLTKKTLEYYNIDETSAYIDSLEKANNELFFMVDSLVLNDLEASRLPDSVFFNEARFTILDTIGNYIDLKKDSSYMRVTSAQGEKRITSWWDGDRRNIMFMDGKGSSISVIELENGSIIDFNGYTIKIDEK